MISTEPVMQDETPPLISGMDTVDKALNEGTVYYDILFKVTVPNTDNKMELIINLEAQNDYYPGYPLLTRGNYYAGRLLTSQRGREFIGFHYGVIKKVYTIWICLNPPKEKENAINSIQQKVRPIVGHAKEKKEEYALMTLIMVYLGDPKDTENNLLKLLDVLFSNKIRANEKKKLIEKSGIEMTEKIESEVYEMCNFSKEIEDKALKKGIFIGREEGLLEGKEKNQILNK